MTLKQYKRIQYILLTIHLQISVKITCLWL